MHDSNVTDLNLKFLEEKGCSYMKAILNHQTAFEKSESVTTVKLMNTRKVTVSCSRMK